VGCMASQPKRPPGRLAETAFLSDLPNLAVLKAKVARRRGSADREDHPDLAVRRVREAGVAGHGPDSRDRVGYAAAAGRGIRPSGPQPIVDRQEHHRACEREVDGRHNVPAISEEPHTCLV
jgi:hypothetical protein